MSDATLSCLEFFRPATQHLQDPEHPAGCKHSFIHFRPTCSERNLATALPTTTGRSSGSDPYCPGIQHRRIAAGLGIGIEKLGKEICPPRVEHH